LLILNGRDQKVILDTDLAELYGVPTKVFNQAVKCQKVITSFEQKATEWPWFTWFASPHSFALFCGRKPAVRTE